MTQVLKELSNAKPKWREIRQIIANSNTQDFEEIMRYLYDNASVYAGGKEGMVAVYIIADANVSDFEELYRYLYDHAYVYASCREGMVAIYINEYSYQSNFRIDKEINCMALIQKLIELK